MFLFFFLPNSLSGFLGWERVKNFGSAHSDIQDPPPKKKLTLKSQLALNYTRVQFRAVVQLSIIYSTFYKFTDRQKKVSANTQAHTCMHTLTYV